MRFILTVLTLAAIAYCSALAWFITTIPGTPAPITQKAPVLVVLTGGYARIEHGLELLADKEAPVLFISGVDDHVAMQRILRDYADADLRGRVYASGGEIVIDHAHSTVSNAEQTDAFLKKRHFTTIRLITANYHMRRALHEFHNVMPDVTIIPDPVSPKEFQRNNWWTNDIARRVIFGEFHKYMAVLVRDWLRPNETPPQDGPRANESAN